MKTLIIDRSRWRRGGDGPELTEKFGATTLLNSDGMMCCLGFDAKACGVPEIVMTGQGSPEELDTEHLPESYLNSPRFNRQGEEDEFYCDSDLVRALVMLNDESKISDSDREAQITPLLMNLGWERVEFVN